MGHLLDKMPKSFIIINPTGPGTGLGLSLAEDIVKAHGEIKDITKKDEGSEFIIELASK